MRQKNATLVSGKLPSYLSNNFPKLSSTGILFARYTNILLMRSFALSINIMRSLLVIRHNLVFTE